MKEKLTRNIGLKILAIILAVLLWLIITNVENPIVTDTFHNITVEVLNGKKITENNQAYQITEGKTIDITFKARRKIADNLTPSNFKATADLAKLSDMDNVTINVSCPGYTENEVSIKDVSTRVLTVEREQLEEKRFKVDVKQIGEPAEGYYIYQKSTNTLITVTGPKSKIESISAIVAEVDVTEAAGSFRLYETPKALDEKGNQIESSSLKYSENSVPIDIKMYRTKSIDLIITTSGTPAAGFVMTAVDYEPKTIEIAGDDITLYNIQNLTVDEDITGATRNISSEINLADRLPEGLYLVGDSQTTVVDITIEKAVTKELMLQPKDLEVRNKPADKEVLYLTTVPVTLQLSGPSDIMADISVKDVAPYIDLAEYTDSGTYQLSIKTDNGSVSLLNSPVISLYLD